MPDTLTTAQAAKRIGVSVQTLRAWRKSGDGPRYYRLGDGPYARVRYRAGDVDGWIGKRIQGGRHDG